MAETEHPHPPSTSVGLPECSQVSIISRAEPQLPPNPVARSTLYHHSSNLQTSQSIPFIYVQQTGPFSEREIDAQRQLALRQAQLQSANHVYPNCYPRTSSGSVLNDNHVQSVRGPSECYGQLSNVTAPMIANQSFARQPNQTLKSLQPQQKQLYTPRSTQIGMPLFSMPPQQFCIQEHYSNLYNNTTNQFGSQQTTILLHGHCNDAQPIRASFMQGSGRTELQRYQGPTSNPPGLYQSFQNSSSITINQNMLNSELRNTSQQQMYSTANTAFPWSNTNPYPVSQIAPESRMQGPRNEYGNVQTIYPSQVASNQRITVDYYASLHGQAQLRINTAITGSAMTTQPYTQSCIQNQMPTYRQIQLAPRANSIAGPINQSTPSIPQQQVQSTFAEAISEIQNQQQQKVRAWQQQQHNNSVKYVSNHTSMANHEYSVVQSQSSNSMFKAVNQNAQPKVTNAQSVNQVVNQFMSTGQSGQQLFNFNSFAESSLVPTSLQSHSTSQQAKTVNNGFQVTSANATAHCTNSKQISTTSPVAATQPPRVSTLNTFSVQSQTSNLRMAVPQSRGTVASEHSNQIVSASLTNECVASSLPTLGAQYQQPSRSTTSNLSNKLSHAATSRFGRPATTNASKCTNSNLINTLDYIATGTPLQPTLPVTQTFQHLSAVVSVPSENVQNEQSNQSSTTTMTTSLQQRIYTSNLIPVQTLSTNLPITPTPQPHSIPQQPNGKINLPIHLPRNSKSKNRSLQSHQPQISTSIASRVDTLNKIAISTQPGQLLPTPLQPQTVNHVPVAILAQVQVSCVQPNVTSSCPVPTCQPTAISTSLNPSYASQLTSPNQSTTNEFLQIDSTNAEPFEPQKQSKACSNTSTSAQLNSQSNTIQPNVPIKQERIDSDLMQSSLKSGNPNRMLIPNRNIVEHMKRMLRTPTVNIYKRGGLDLRESFSPESLIGCMFEHKFDLETIETIVETFDEIFINGRIHQKILLRNDALLPQSSNGAISYASRTGTQTGETENQVPVTTTSSVSGNPIQTSTSPFQPTYHEINGNPNSSVTSVPSVQPSNLETSPHNVAKPQPPQTRNFNASPANTSNRIATGSKPTQPQHSTTTTQSNTAAENLMHVAQFTVQQSPANSPIPSTARETPPNVITRALSATSSSNSIPKEHFQSTFDEHLGTFFKSMVEWIRNNVEKCEKNGNYDDPDTIYMMDGYDLRQKSPTHLVNILRKFRCGLKTIRGATELYKDIFKNGKLVGRKWIPNDKDVPLVVENDIEPNNAVAGQILVTTIEPSYDEEDPFPDHCAQPNHSEVNPLAEETAMPLRVRNTDPNNLLQWIVLGHKQNERLAGKNFFTNFYHKNETNHGVNHITTGTPQLRKQQMPVVQNSIEAEGFSQELPQELPLESTPPCSQTTAPLLQNANLADNVHSTQRFPKLICPNVKKQFAAMQQQLRTERAIRLKQDIRDSDAVKSVPSISVVNISPNSLAVKSSCVKSHAPLDYSTTTQASVLSVESSTPQPVTTTKSAQLVSSTSIQSDPQPQLSDQFTNSSILKRRLQRAKRQRVVLWNSESDSDSSSEIVHPNLLPRKTSIASGSSRQMRSTVTQNQMHKHEQHHSDGVDANPRVAAIAQANELHVQRTQPQSKKASNNRISKDSNSGDSASQVSPEQGAHASFDPTNVYREGEEGIEGEILYQQLIYRKPICICKSIEYIDYRPLIPCFGCGILFHLGCIKMSNEMGNEFDSMLGWVFECNKCNKDSPDNSEWYLGPLKCPQLFRCICDRPFDRRKAYVECERCQKQFHQACFGLVDKQASLLPEFFCLQCTELNIEGGRLKPTLDDKDGQAHLKALENRFSKECLVERFLEEDKKRLEKFKIMTRLSTKNDYSLFKRAIKKLKKNAYSTFFHKKIPRDTYLQLYNMSTSSNLDLASIRDEIRNRNYEKVGEFVFAVNDMLHSLRRYTRRMLNDFQKNKQNIIMPSLVQEVKRLKVMDLDQLNTFQQEEQNRLVEAESAKRKSVVSKEKPTYTDLNHLSTALMMFISRSVTELQNEFARYMDTHLRLGVNWPAEFNVDPWSADDTDKEQYDVVMIPVHSGSCARDNSPPSRRDSASAKGPRQEKSKSPTTQVMEQSSANGTESTVGFIVTSQLESSLNQSLPTAHQQSRKRQIEMSVSEKRPRKLHLSRDPHQPGSSRD